MKKGRVIFGRGSPSGVGKVSVTEGSATKGAMMTCREVRWCRLGGANDVEVAQARKQVQDDGRGSGTVQLQAAADCVVCKEGVERRKARGQG